MVTFQETGPAPETGSGPIIRPPHTVASFVTRESLAFRHRQKDQALSVSASWKCNINRHEQIGGIVEVRGPPLGHANCACNSSARNGVGAAHTELEGILRLKGELRSASSLTV